MLDATKIVPEELVPVVPVGRLVLNRNPDNFFAETEQVAFHLSNLPPGIDVTNDPLLQGRLFSYLDTQLLRLGGPNFSQIPVNRPLAEVHNVNQDGFGQHRIPTNKANYSPNTIGGGCPAVATHAQGASPFGVMDLAGNVAEWVLDEYMERYRPCPGSRCVDPIVRPSSETAPRVVRGGSWHREIDASRITGRSFARPDDVTGDVGFRCVRPIR